MEASVLTVGIGRTRSSTGRVLLFLFLVFLLLCIICRTGRWHCNNIVPFRDIQIPGGNGNVERHLAHGIVARQLIFVQHTKFQGSRMLRRMMAEGPGTTQTPRQSIVPVRMQRLVNGSGPTQFEAVFFCRRSPMLRSLPFTKIDFDKGITGR